MDDVEPFANSRPAAPDRGEPWTVLWTRGRSCARIAEILSAGSATRVEGDLKTQCIAKRANVLVTAKAGGFDLASTVVPEGVDEATPVPAVVGAVGTGPHSELAAQVTVRLAAGLNATPTLVTMVRDQSEEATGHALLDAVAGLNPGVRTECVRADSVAELVAALPHGALLVLGAPGGSWWQRQFFGQGRRLIHAAPAGAVVVRAAARRCFHAAVELTGLGAPMGVEDAFTLIEHAVAPVVDDGRVVGIVRRSALQRAPLGATVGDIMEPPVVATAAEHVEAAAEVAGHFEGAPVPVVDDDGFLLGGVIV